MCRCVAFSCVSDVVATRPSGLTNAGTFTCTPVLRVAAARSSSRTSSMSMWLIHVTVVTDDRQAWKLEAHERPCPCHHFHQHQQQQQRTLEHWLQTCPTASQQQQQLQTFGSANPPIDILTSEPLCQVIVYAREGPFFRDISWRHIQQQQLPTADQLCQKCCQSSQTLEHWLQICPATQQRRLQIFGTADPPLDILTTDPLQVILYARETLSWHGTSHWAAAAAAAAASASWSHLVGAPGMNIVEQTSPPVDGHCRVEMTASSSSALSDADATAPDKTTTSADDRSDQRLSRMSVKRNTCVVKLDGCRYTISKYRRLYETVSYSYSISPYNANVNAKLMLAIFCEIDLLHFLIFILFLFFLFYLFYFFIFLFFIHF